jgi:hypothetical protein
MPQIMASYEDATNFYSQVRAARSERTAHHWRDAIDAARRRLDAERGAGGEGHRDPHPAGEFVREANVA